MTERRAIDIADDFARRVERAHGGDGRAWLGRLPALIDECERRWLLSVGPPFTPLSSRLSR